jgi:hypothetical protein
MKLKNIIPLTALALTLFTGCASIVDGGRKSVQINSNPAGAKVSIFDSAGKTVFTETTPATVRLKRNHGYFQGEDYRLSFELPGYYPAETHVKSVINGWYFGNIMFGGLIGLVIVDPATGANFTLAPREINWNLVALDPALTPEQVAEAQTKVNVPKPPLRPAPAKDTKKY